MTISEYQDFVLTRSKSCSTQEVDGPTLNVLHWSLGLSGEVGELVDTVKKHVFYNQEFDYINAQEELGDILFYVSAMASELGLSMEYLMENNAAKLKLRYPKRYSDECATLRADKTEEEVANGAD